MKIAALASAALLGACGGGGGGGGSGTGGLPLTDAGILKVALTDAPACGYNQINVTVQKVRVHASSTAADSDPGWSEVVLGTPQRVDLLTLTNGNVLELGQVTLPVGTYRQMSLVLAANDAGSPLANAVTPFGQSERALSAPAGLQTGLKIPVNIVVAKDQVSDYVLDFDACNSVLRLGTSGNYALSPRYSVVQRLSATGQRVTGWVATSLDPTTTRISVQTSGSPLPTVVRSTVPDGTGRFVLYPVPSGTYNLVISAPDRVPATVTGVPVTDTGSTDVSTQGAPIDPPVAVLHTATGTVNTGSAPVDARVAIVKGYSNGQNAVVAAAPADATTGGLAYTLAAGAAVRAPFSAAPLVFSADGAAPTGLYTIVVTSGGATKTQVVDATNSDPAPVTITFP